MDEQETPLTPEQVRAQAQAPFIVGGVLIALVVLVFALSSFIILLVGMIPTIIARALPASPEQKKAVMTMAMLNLAGVLPVLAMLWSRGPSLGTATGLLGEPLPWLFMLGGAGIAVLLQSVLPNAAISVMEHAAEHRVQRLKIMQKDLVGEWGADVKSRVPPKPGDGAEKETKS